MNELAERARSWLHDTYGQRVALRGEESILSAERVAFFGCRYVESDEPMLAATICVPLDGKAGVDATAGTRAGCVVRPDGGRAWTCGWC
ncbi:hypothetical protein [Saccharopolyspora pogona]|uniref:hypothetical protein n=1 Tax=Saccharopolyspora pogona TaxID=333966 RepID=UPI00168896A9|nr:hypothetical protein [Saccharopolyspora pogona]